MDVRKEKSNASRWKIHEKKALEEARKAYDSNEVPVGAIVVAERTNISERS
jgi:tRNA(Arg) A34 adenosine deaminase TadA